MRSSLLGALLIGPLSSLLAAPLLGVLLYFSSLTLISVGRSDESLGETLAMLLGLSLLAYFPARVWVGPQAQGSL